MLVQFGQNLYPGNKRCSMSPIPHAKWHTEAGLAFLDLVYVADEIHRATTRDSAKGTLWSIFHSVFNG